jgi:hypothetical protein
MLRAAPIVTGIAILSLALGIGANTAIFSLVNSLLLRTLPVSEPERLVLLSDASNPRRAWTYGLWEEIRRRAPQMFAGAVAWSATGSQDRLNLSMASEEVQLSMARMSAAISLRRWACQRSLAARSRQPTMCVAADRMAK